VQSGRRDKWGSEKEANEPLCQNQLTGQSCQFRCQMLVPLAFLTDLIAVKIIALIIQSDFQG